MNITYLGHSSLLVEHDGIRVVIDPFLSGNPQSAVQAAELKVNAVLLTHGHDDHFGDTLEIAAKNDCPVVAIHELAVFCSSKGVKAHGMNLGGSHQFEGFRVKLMPAWHSNSVRDGDKLLYAGEPAGILLTMGGKTLYHAGDTALFSDLKLVSELHKLDAAALPIGDNYTMGPEEAAIASEWLRPGVVIPLHFNTFPMIRQDGDAFVKLCEAKGIRACTLAAGESLEV
ncbi:metal-dependent hydrolase [Gorillibacterium sp. sgz5001074]|uniref:metal-dependent hydrolase n=1 Tax=Gorillibacterium sp. sgz5001074 TaxID=3446695 RepID=UPI003F67D3ED